jgi:bacterioferritin-associated ferredoxin
MLTFVQGRDKTGAVVSITWRAPRSIRGQHMYVCICKAIREDTVRELGRCGVLESAQLAGALGLDTPECCGRCIRSIDRFVELASDTEIEPEHGMVSSAKAAGS